MKELLTKMLAQLSDEDKLIFNNLAQKLNETDGDISLLSDDELAIISKMEAKYSDKLSNINIERMDLSDVVETSDVIENETSSNLLNTGFASFVRQLLAKNLKEQFPNEEDAVRFAFQNKWLPEEVKNSESVAKIFSDYKEDIGDANHWREEVIGVESDKTMAVGMTWFMVIYQLNKALN